MTKVIVDISISADGFSAGLDQTEERPFGNDTGNAFGNKLHDWIFTSPEMADQHLARLASNKAFILGRNMFGPVRGEWDREWRGWWGENPPYHTPVFVLTHRPGPPIEREGGTVFHFLEATPAEALEIARDAAAGQDVRIGGGPSVVRDFLAAGLVDHLHVVQVPILLGRGVRLWDGLEGVEDGYDVEAVSSPSGVTHLTFTRKA